MMANHSPMLYVAVTAICSPPPRDNLANMHVLRQRQLQVPSLSGAVNHWCLRLGYSWAACSAYCLNAGCAAAGPCCMSSCAARASAGSGMPLSSSAPASTRRHSAFWFTHGVPST